jgi:hypothetical protein
MKQLRTRGALAFAALSLAFAGCNTEPSSPNPPPASGVNASSSAQHELALLRARFPKAPLRAAAAGLPARVSVTLPNSSSGDVELRDKSSSVALRFRASGAATAERSDVDGVALYAGAGTVLRVTETGVEDFVSFATKPEREEVVYSVDVSEAAGLRLIDDSLELLDARGTPRLRVTAPYVLEQGGAVKPAQLAVEGCAYETNPRAPWGRVVTAPGNTRCTLRVTWSNVSYPALLDPAWESAGSSSARDTHTAVKLTSGKVLVLYGYFCGGGCLLGKGASLFDPATNTFAGTGSGGFGVGVGAPGVGLKNGNALLAGSSTLLYDAVAGTFSDSKVVIDGSMAFTLLDSGKVLLTGTSAALYDPTSDSVQPAGTMIDRTGAATVRLPSGKVLVIGGGGLASADIYDPVTNQFTPSKGSMAVARTGHKAVTLASGKVLIVDGVSGAAELYDPEQDSFTVTGSLQQPRSAFEMAPLESGRALVVGGFIGKSATTSVERYEPGTNRFVTGPSLLTARGYHRLTLLDDGSLLATFGRNQDDSNFGNSIGSAERLTLVVPGAACTADDACRSGVCDHGICCASTCTSKCHACAPDTGACEVVKDAEDPDTCRGGNTCDANGDCKAKNGERCKGAPECVSGHCVDGFCCDQACDGTCEACDGLVPGSCAAVAGVPHGERACTGGNLEICAGACDGKHTAACAYPDSATGCGTSCDGSARVARTCDGKGECVDQAARPCPGNLICADATTCLTECASDGDCIEGYACEDGACKPTARCDGDHTIRAADGKSTTDCTPFKCDSQVRCKTKCESVADCANPFVCNPDGNCVAAPPHTIAASCAFAAPTTTSGRAFAWLALLGALAVRRRRSAAQKA